jgi:hypothetical protein
MKFTPTLTPAMAVLVAGLALAGCQKSTTDAQADAVRDTTKAEASSMDTKADAVADQGSAVGGATEDNAKAAADAMHDNADAIKKEGEAKADAIESGTIGATTKTDSATTTTEPTKK